MNKENQNSKIDFNEQVILNSSLNTQIFDKIFISDLIKLEYTKEIDFKVVSLYIKHIKQNHFQFSEEIPKEIDDLSVNQILVLKEWILIHIEISEGNKKVTLISNEKRIDEEKANIINLLENFNSIKFKEISLENSSEFACNFVTTARNYLKDPKSSIDQLIIKKNPQIVIEELINFVYSISKIPAKRLLFLIQEARELAFHSKDSELDHSNLSLSPNTDEDIIPAFARRERASLKSSQLPIKEITNTINNKSKEIKYFHEIKSKPFIPQLNTDLINEESSIAITNRESVQISSMTSRTQRSNSYDFKSDEIDELRIDPFELEYSASEEQSNLSFRLSGTITTNFSGLETLSKPHQTPGSVSMGSVPEFVRDSYLEYSESQHDSLNDSSVSNHFDSGKTRFNDSLTRLNSPREGAYTIQDIKKHFNLNDIKMSLETHDNTFYKSEITELGDRGFAYMNQEFEIMNRPIKRDLPQLMVERKVVSSCQCSKCSIF
ncbi:unnamed protein product [Blepharisma stoltei]|uniref:Uncharacterized protein n=1 Tax=Blepharisma stoltei TaxID=1481888 RepID=A0AAU9JG96_9CILI|nr:unnamed protein product [Blepharisma stoltei]